MSRGGASRNRAAHAAPHRAPAPSALARAAVLAAGTLAALGLASCSKKVTTVDSSFTSPEGVSSTQVGLTVWRELPNHLYIFRRGQPNADPPARTIRLGRIDLATGTAGPVTSQV